jgi:hypothetical protein
VVQYNKRDLPNAAPVNDLEEQLNPGWSIEDPARQAPTPDPYNKGRMLIDQVDGTWIERAPYFESVAVTGDGVFETLRAVAKLVLKTLS